MVTKESKVEKLSPTLNTQEDSELYKGPEPIFKLCEPKLFPIV